MEFFTGALLGTVVGAVVLIIVLLACSEDDPFDGTKAA